MLRKRSASRGIALFDSPDELNLVVYKIDTTILTAVYEMDTDYPADERVLSYLEHVQPETQEGTRIYRERGPDLLGWVDSIQEWFGGELIPSEWVPDYVGVTRAAVHKRFKRGQLTLFVYELHDYVESLITSNLRTKMRNEYRYVPRSECDIWRLNSIQHPERSDIDALGSPYIHGWWTEAMTVTKPKRAIYPDQ